MGDVPGTGFGKHTSDPERWKKPAPVEAFVYRYLAHHMKFPTPDYHREFYWALEDSNRICELSPRGFGKSFRASFFTPLAYAALGRVKKIAIISKTAGLAERMLSYIKNEIETNKLLREDFPNLRRGPKWSNDHMITSNGVEIWAKGFGAQIRGDHPELIVIDDPEDEESASSEVTREKMYEVFLRTIMGALEEEPGMEHAGMIMIGTNIHPDCMVNRVFTNYENRYDHWAVLFFCAILPDGTSIWDSKFPIEKLEAKRREIGSAAFNSEYMNEPLLGEAVLFYPDYFRNRYKVDPKEIVKRIPSNDRRVVCAVDIAQSMRESADRSAWVIGCREFSTNRKWILEGGSERVPTRHLARSIAIKCDEFDVDVCFVEDPLKESTDPEKQSIIPSIFREEFFAMGTRTHVRTVRPDKDKYRRALKVQAMAERREIYWMEKLTPGLRRVYDEVIRFPLGGHDDGLDAFVYCMRKLDQAHRQSEQKDMVRMGSGYYVRH